MLAVHSGSGGFFERHVQRTPRRTLLHLLTAENGTRAENPGDATWGTCRAAAWNGARVKATATRNPAGHHVHAAAL